jgi:exopolyphosphatase/guanosine-5'-triphosphate,3'-diphosphate pyrophosphatase
MSDRGITAAGLERLRARLIEAGRVEDSGLLGLKPDRIPVFAGGVAIMSAIFDELEIEVMHYGEGALRLGVLYDLLGRTQHEDMRRISVEQAMRRYAVDVEQARRIGELAMSLWRNLKIGSEEERSELDQQLLWAACLHEIGHSISHNSFHKHSAYILTHADMPGFSRREQQAVAALVLGQVGKLNKVQSLMASRPGWAALLCFRLSCLFYRRRFTEDLPQVTLSTLGQGFSVSVAADWLAAHPLTEFGLQQESAEWAKLGFDLQFKAVQAGEAVMRQSSAGA